MARRVFCATLGCDKNLVDSEALLGRFALSGVQAVADPEEADIWILNSCGFIDAARRDSEETLLELIEHKGERILVVCGCWSQEHGEDIQQRFPGVDIVAGVGQFDRVVAACMGQADPATGGDGAPPSGIRKNSFPLVGSPLVEDPMVVQYTGMLDRPLLTPQHLAFVKIGEGCNFNCSFCRIPMIRGKQRSRTTAEIVTEVRGLVQRGVSEIQLVSQNTSDFGRDTGENLLGLTTALNGIDGLRWIRLLYLYPGLVSVGDLLALLDLPLVVPYLDLPIQHASDRLLSGMRRPGGNSSNSAFFRALRRERPDLVLRSTALLGFPGEEDEDVSRLADFLAEVEFDHLGTYRYSPEAGTDAAGLPDRVPDEVILDRECLIMDLQAGISLGRQISRLGRSFEVVIDQVVPSLSSVEAEDVGLQELVESLAEGEWLAGREREDLSGVQGLNTERAIGRSHHYGYDLDGVVVTNAAGLRAGDRVQLEFTGVSSFDTWAEKPEPTH
ncbi:MAG: MiaB/RimO family radical SAM methylthiotransferase [Gemmatimonadales bacterium]|nr:MiaB/RimO family radical SAM methylthiotransferase [Gemmatimonadales bacterium]